MEHLTRAFATRLLAALGLSAATLAGACGGIAVIDPGDGGAGGSGGAGSVCDGVAPEGYVAYQACIPMQGDVCMPASDALLDTMNGALAGKQVCDELGCYCPFAVTVECDQPPNVSTCCYGGLAERQLCGVEGRPFVPQGHARQAEVHPRHGWSDATLGDGHSGSSPSSPLRSRLVHAWASDALAEHASVASFARHALELLAVGAPLSLVRRAHAAALDEVRHARASFSIAARFAGAPLSPARLDTSGSTPRGTTLCALLATTIRDGCVNETVSALRARASADAASDPVVRAALERIAADEAAHAELAWHTVGWALQAGGPEAVQLAEQAFAEALAVGSSAAAAELHTGDDALRSHGQLGPHEAAQLTLTTLAHVVAPCAHALLAAVRDGQAHEGAPRRAS